MKILMLLFCPILFAQTQIGGASVAGCVATATGPTNLSCVTGPSVVLNGNAYNLVTGPRVFLDGTGGSFTAVTSPGAGNGRAITSNPAYQGLINSVGILISTGYTKTWVDYLGSVGSGWNEGRFSNAAMLWWAQGANPADPNNYLAAAKYGLDHVEDIIGSTSACDETATYCNGRASEIDFVSFYLVPVMQAYSITRSQMSSSERTAFAAKMLNDNAVSLNGLGLAGSPTSSCTRASGGGPGSNDISVGTGTVSFSISITSSTATTSTMTGTSTAFTAQLSVGSVIFGATGAPVAKVTAIATDTSATVAATGSYTGAFRYAPSWNTSTNTDCGVVWLLKHHGAAPPLDPTQTTTYTSDYPLNAAIGQFTTLPAITGIQAEHNLVLTKLFGYIAIGIALADDDPRAITLLQQAFNFYYTYALPWKLSQDTGLSSCVPSDGIDRCDVFESGLMMMIRNSIIGAPNLIQLKKTSLAREVPMFMYMMQPDKMFNNFSYELWDELFGINGSAWGPYALSRLSYLNLNQTESTWAQSLLQTQNYTASLWAMNAGAYLQSEYLFYDPAAPLTAYTTAPTQYVFKDGDYATCLSMSFTCFANHTFEMTLSKSSWATNATQMLTQGGWAQSGIDHIDGPDFGSYHIYKNGYLLAGDGSNTTSDSNGTLGGDNLIALGGGDWLTNGAYAPISRWASTDPYGDPLNRYAYVMYNLSSVYSSGAGATGGVYRHIAHLKENQDYIISFDDITTLTAEEQQAYFHYWRQTAVNTIKYDASARTMSDLNGTTAGLLTSFLPTAGVNTIAMSRDTADGTYPGQLSNGTYRMFICTSTDGSTCNTSATHGEWLAVHLPTTTTTAVMPMLTQPSCTAIGGTCVALQVADSTTPKVISFTRGAALVSVISFTTTHTGTGQYLITGLAAGNYSVSVGGSTVVSNIVVSTNDNTLYFESTSGVVSIMPL
jgi:hypothetical protein